MSEQSGKFPVVRLETSLGTVKIALRPDKAPITVNNFLTYVKEGFYDGLIFHRVVSNFIVQTGGFEPGMVYRTPTHPPIKNEADNGLKNVRGAVAMARAYPIDSAAAQFFINLVDNPRLDHYGPEPAEFGYAVFGQVVEGMEVLEKMAFFPVTVQAQHQNVPVQDIIIVKAVLEEA
jgi:cyclophilin family peptidyl-prolyl cis-trans isomerase|uniref:Peptidyl-prolyl cis-trans isomerase n=1 Tax=Desulfobacca acetoxidans TaxID=60893 RepID=A0A7C3SI60_9BACT